MKTTSLVKLIANDIVHIGIDDTLNMNYILGLNEYIDDFDNESQDYIKSHLNQIINEIRNNEYIADVDYNQDENTVDMVFYINSVTDRIEKVIYNIGLKNGNEYDVEKLHTLSENLINDSKFNNYIEKELIDKNMEV